MINVKININMLSSWYW